MDHRLTRALGALRPAALAAALAFAPLMTGCVVRVAGPPPAPVHCWHPGWRGPDGFWHRGHWGPCCWHPGWRGPYGRWHPGHWGPC